MINQGAAGNIVVVRTAKNGPNMDKNKNGDRVPGKTQQIVSSSGQKEGHLIQSTHENFYNFTKAANNAQGPTGGNLLNMPLRLKEGKG